MKAKKRKSRSKYAIYEKYIFSALRRIFTYGCTDNYKVALDEAKVGPAAFLCYKCKGVYSRGDINLDHSSPVMLLGGWDGGWDSYIKRMFHGKVRVLCRTCHKTKTAEERKIRNDNKKENK